MKKLIITLVTTLLILAGCSSKDREQKAEEEEDFFETRREIEKLKEDLWGTIEEKPVEENTEDPKSIAEANAIEHAASPGKKLFGEDFKGMDYHFAGELVKTELVEGLFGNMEEALLVRNENGFILVIFPNYEITVEVGDEIEAWGPLSGDGYASSDLGIDNVVGVTGGMNASIIYVNGVMQ